MSTFFNILGLNVVTTHREDRPVCNIVKMGVVYTKTVTMVTVSVNGWHPALNCKGVFKALFLNGFRALTNFALQSRIFGFGRPTITMKP